MRWVVTTSQAPLRMLITRRTARHLSSLGFLAPQKFDGTFGKATVAAVTAFQRAHDLPVNVP
jgi:peptidoglycan hydrolase-like protein with peptidoglycan-binding domain